MERKYNFNPGPGVLPLPALERAAQALIDFEGTGLGILETSHRSKEFTVVIDAATERLRRLLGIPDDYDIGYFQGGANLQFSMLAMNFLPSDGAADYVDTGTWSSRAIQAAGYVGKANVVASTKEEKYQRVPRWDEVTWNETAAYAHITSNNTIYGTQFQSFPDTGKVPLICDMSSDFLSRRIDVSRFAMIYAGAQKNVGPAGVTLVIMRKDMLDRCPDTLPPMLNYSKFLAKKSTYNTPPVFSIFMVGEVLRWVEENGGLDTVEKNNDKKAGLLYGLMDEDPDFFRGTAKADSRSKMNVTMRLPSEDLEKAFLAEAAEKGFVGLKGHRSVGGIRVSIYNAMSVEGVEKLVAFMKSFRKSH